MSLFFSFAKKTKAGTNPKVLVIRFSSFGDVVQSLSIFSAIKKHWPESHILWLTKKDFQELGARNPYLDGIVTLPKGSGLRHLYKLIKQMRQMEITHLYDAHNNLRSFLVVWGIAMSCILGGKAPPKILVRKMFRWKRFLLFQLRINTFKGGFSGQRDLLIPLEKWGIPFALPEAPQLFLEDVKNQTKNIVPTGTDYVCLAPSSAHYLKKWPIYKWYELIAKNPDILFVLLGGKEDVFIEELHLRFFSNTLNLAGKTNLLESSQVVKNAKLLIANDTGLLHVAEQLGKPVIALMGPAPFGFPSRMGSSTWVMEKKLKCRPCSKHGQGPCYNKTHFHECLDGISVKEVHDKLHEVLHALV